MIRNNITNYATRLREQNAHPVNYADFQIGGLLDEMLHHDVNGKLTKENILMSPFIVDIHQTKFTEAKGIWMIEATKEVLHKGSQNVEMLLALLPVMLPTELFN
eukprot:9474260-Ditylum_brightwellii.AAC.1